MYRHDSDDTSAVHQLQAAKCRTLAVALLGIQVCTTAITFAIPTHSVFAHVLAGDASAYRFMNTFIDDVFAFIIKMPMLHRLR